MIYSFATRCRAQIIPGAAIAKQIKDEVKADVERWIGAGNKRPHLSVILVGDNPASHTYVRNKIKACTHTGEAFGCYKYCHFGQHWSLRDGIESQYWACEKVASDCGLGGGFHWVLRFSAPVTSG